MHNLLRFWNAKPLMLWLKQLSLEIVIRQLWQLKIQLLDQLPNYALLDQYGLIVIGEFYLSIQHNLMCLSGQSIKDIKEVHSHPMALLQCKNFFLGYPHIKLVESHDTAEEAMKIKKNSIIGRGAIAGINAAEIYGLSIISESIQTIKNNVTRFVIVQKEIPKQRIILIRLLGNLY